LRTARPGLHLFRGLAGISAMYCFFYAIAHLPLANAMILKMSAPLFIPLIAWWWLKERLDLRIAAVVLLGFVGVWLILKPDPGQFAEDQKIALIALAGGFFAALAKTTVKKLTGSENPMVIVFYFALTGLLVSAIPAAIAWKTPQGAEWLHLIAVGVLASLGQVLMTRAYGHAPASQISHYGYSSILYASLIGWWLWDEWMDGWAWLGAALVALSGMLLIRRRPVTLPADAPASAGVAAPSSASSAPAERSPPA
jgi:drug/metabolite transporter (DMT)-like permease